MSNDLRRTCQATAAVAALLVAAMGVTAGALGAVTATPGVARGATARPTVRGSVGVGTYNTVAQFKDLVVTGPDGKTMFSADLSKGLGDWYFHGGQWKVVDDYLKQSTSDPDCWATIGDTAWTDYTVSVKARKIVGDEGFLLLFRVRDVNNNYCWFNVGGWKNVRAQVETTVAGTRTAIGPSVNIVIDPNRWYDLKVEVRGESAKCYVDGKLLCETELSQSATTAAGQARGNVPATQGRGPTAGRGSTTQAAAANATRPGARAGVTSPATQATQTATPNANDRFAAMERQLRDPNKAPKTAAIADLKKYYAQDPVNAEHAMWRLRGLLAPLTDRVPDVMELTRLAWAAKNRPDGDHSDPGYLYALEASCLFQLKKPDEALAKIRQGVQVDPVHASEEFISYITKAVPPKEADSALAEILPWVAAGKPEDAAVVETALRLRIEALSRTGRHGEALADARSFFNVCAMRNTAQALTLLDRQLLLAQPGDTAMSELFRREQIAGAAMPGADEAPKKSTVLPTIAIQSPAFEEALRRAKGGGGAAFQEILRKAALLLLVGDADGALVVVQQASSTARTSGNGNDINAAAEFTARCYKAQDGTLGRANAFVAAGRNVASATRPVPATLPAAADNPGLP